MHETPATSGLNYPGESLAKYRWHTGATLAPLGADEPCPILFRDVGLEATRRFLEGGLERLAGPFTPLTYMRTWRYREPYVDYETCGRLVFLRPLALHPWRSGLDFIYVADARRTPEPETVAWVPGDLPLERAAALVEAARTRAEAREAFGGRAHDQALCETRHRLAAVEAEARRVERLAEPLRRALQSGDARAREQMARARVSESDLCAAWHHLPRPRREALEAALLELRGAEGAR